MQRFGWTTLAVGPLVALAAMTASAGAPTNPPPRLTLDLVDGSRVIGVPVIESMPVQTAYARMEIPLKQVLSITMEAK